MALTWIIWTNYIHMSQATLFPLTPQLQIDFHSPGSCLCQTMSSQPATEHCLVGTADEKLMAVTSKQLINIAGNTERRKSTEKKQYSRPGFQEGWVFTVDTSEGSFKSPGADQLWAAEAAPLLLQHIREMERNGVQNSSPWHINPPK